MDRCLITVYKPERYLTEMHRINITVEFGKSERDVEIAVSGLALVQRGSRGLDNYQLQPYLVTTGNYVKMVSEAHAGELSYALLIKDEGEVYVTVASDHSDKEAEKCNLVAGKHMYPKVIARRAWRLRDVEPKWGGMELRSWVELNGEKRQAAYLKGSDFPSPGSVVSIIGKTASDLRNLVIIVKPLSPLASMSSSYNEISIEDPTTGRSINHYYWVE